MNEPVERMNLVIFNADGLLLTGHEIEILRKSYHPQRLGQFHMLDDHLGYTFIFWTGSDGCDILASEKPQRSTTPFPKVLISLILQPRDPFIHQLTTLRDEFICAVSGRWINLNLKFRAQAQRR
jgi:hypothetical protein